MSDWRHPPRPYAIAHRGASAYAPESSPEAYRKATALGAAFWEVDIHLSADGALMVVHDAALPDGRRIADLTAAEAQAAAADQGMSAVPLAEILDLAEELGAGIYADIKDVEATLPTLQALQSWGIERAILGAFGPEAARRLAEAQSPYPRSVLVRVGQDPFEIGRDADILHLCWEHMPRPQDLLTPDFFAKAEAQGKQVVLWHEEDPDRMAALRHLPVLGICSDRPELVHPFEPPAEWPVEIVCHRGACEYAPENTAHAAHCAFAAGFSVVELDVNQSADGTLLVIHDGSVDRTTNGRGAVSWHSTDTLRSLDAGRRYSEHYQGTQIPTFAEYLAIARLYQGQLYVELKDADPMAVLAEVEHSGLMDRCFFWSFRRAHLETIRKARPDARIMVRRQDMPSLDACLALDPYVVEFTLDEDPAEIAQAPHAMVAYMGRNKEAFARLIELRPAMVNLHFPFAFRDYLRNHLKNGR